MASTYITKTPSSTTNQKTWTVSCWVKRSLLSSNQMVWGVNGDSSGNYFTELLFTGSDKLEFRQGGTVGDPYQTQIETNASYRDTNGWYHIVIAADTTQGTEANRLKMYVNGEQITSFATANYPSQNENFRWHYTGYAHSIGRSGQDNARYFDGIISHFHNIDGTQYAASDFGSTDSTTGEWKINVSPNVTYGSFGTFLLKDGNSVTDQSGQGNNWTVGGGTLTKSEDCPSNVFATNNSLWKQESSRYLTHTKGNTMISGGGSSTWYQTPATLAFNSGKFYWECKFNAGTNLDKNTAGVIDYEKTQESGQFQDKTGSVFYKNEDGGETRIDGSTSTADYGTLAQNDILGVAVDMDAATPTVKFYKNGSLLVTANASSLSGKFVTPAQSVYTSGEYQVNYGNGYFGDSAVSSAGTNASGIGIFEHDVPANYTALSTKGLNE